MSEEPVQSLSLFLDAVKSAYPSGIPERVLREAYEQVESARSSLPQPASTVDSRIQTAFAEYLPEGLVVPSRAGPGKVLFVLSAPDLPGEGEHDMLQGKGGALLRAAIEKGFGLSVDEVQITSLFKFAVESGTVPLFPEQLQEVFYDVLMDEVQLAEVVVALGLEAARALVPKVFGSLDEIRGTWLEHKGKSLLVSMDPGEVARNGDLKRAFWDDLKIVKGAIEVMKPACHIQPVDFSDKVNSTSSRSRSRSRARCSLLILILFLAFAPFSVAAEDHVAVVRMSMGIFPGTGEYLKTSISRATRSGAKLIVVYLDTPGGMLQTSQEMIKAIFDSKVPIVVYVSPTGGSATSAGVFITVAAHVAAMAPGTTIGAAHPVMGDGKDIADDMRAKAENITAAMVKTVAEQRGRNVEWVEKAVLESASMTEAEALKGNVVDIVAEDLDDLLKQVAGKEIEITSEKVKLEDYSSLPREEYEISLKQNVINTLANPMVAQILWLGATTGLSIELYNPGAIIPGVVGLICLLLALAVYQIIPINIGGILLLILGAILIGAELAVPSGILGLAGIVSMVFGSIYLIDVIAEPGLGVNMMYIISVASFFGLILLGIVLLAIRIRRNPVTTGTEGLVGLIGEASENITTTGRVFVNGEYWEAVAASGIIEKGAAIRVVAMKSGLLLEVEKVEES